MQKFLNFINIIYFFRGCPDWDFLGIVVDWQGMQK